MFYTTPVLVFPSNTVIVQYKTYYEQNGYVTNIFINLSLGHISSNFHIANRGGFHPTCIPRTDVHCLVIACGLGLPPLASTVFISWMISSSRMNLIMKACVD